MRGATATPTPAMRLSASRLATSSVSVGCTPAARSAASTNARVPAPCLRNNSRRVTRSATPTRLRSHHGSSDATTATKRLHYAPGDATVASDDIDSNSLITHHSSLITRQGGEMPRTLFEKIWDAHVLRDVEGERTVLYIDRHLVHEVTSPQAFDDLRLAGRRVRRPDLTFAVLDHNVPTYD